jgi:phosphopantothenate-cysteine ligase
MEFGEKPLDTITTKYVNVRKNIIITAGGTEEPIDQVRKITNMSTGKLGSMIAEQFLLKFDENYSNNPNLILTGGYKIFYICNKNSIKPSNFPKHLKDVLEIINTTDTNSVKLAIEEILKENEIDTFIHTMAISDYTVESVSRPVYFKNKIDFLQEIDSSSKIDSSFDEIYLKLVKTPKIIDNIKSYYKKHHDNDMKLISFKLKNDIDKNELINIGKKQLLRTKSDIVIANDLKDIKLSNHIAYAIEKDDNDKVNFKINELNGKYYISKFIVNQVLNSAEYANNN